MAFNPFQFAAHAVRDASRVVSRPAALASQGIRDAGGIVTRAASEAELAAKRVHHAASYASRALSVPYEVSRKALEGVTNNPLWNAAQTGVSFIPGIGQGVSAGMAVAAGVGR